LKAIDYFTKQERAKATLSMELNRVDGRDKPGHEGFGGGHEEHFLDTKFEKSFRETLKPLKTLKTAKFGVLRAQRNQRFSKSRNFAGETISFRFGFVFASRERKIPFWDRSARWERGAKNLERAPITK